MIVDVVVEAHHLFLSISSFLLRVVAVLAEVAFLFVEGDFLFAEVVKKMKHFVAFLIRHSFFRRRFEPKATPILASPLEVVKKAKRFSEALQPILFEVEPKLTKKQQHHHLDYYYFYFAAGSL